MTTASAGGRAVSRFSQQLQNASMLAIAWFALAGTGHALSPGDELRGFFWLPSGLLLASLLLSERRDWLPLLAGAALGDAAFAAAYPGVSPGPLRFAATALQALLSAVTVESLLGRPFRIRSLRELLWFLSTSTVVVGFAVAILATLAAGHVADLEAFEQALWPRWNSNGIGVLLLAPLLLAWSEAPGAELHLDHPKRQLEAALLLWVAVACHGLVFVYAGDLATPLRIVLAIPVIWAGLRFGLQGATLVLLGLALPMAWSTGASLLLHGSKAPFQWIAPAQTLISLFGIVGPALALVVRESSEQLAALKRGDVEIRRLNRLYASLSAVNRAMLEQPSAATFLETTSRILVEQGGMLLAAIGRADFAAGRLLPLSRVGPAVAFLDHIEFRLDDSPIGQGPAATAVRENRRYVCNDYDTDPRTGPWREVARSFGIRASAAMPIRNSRGVWGILTIYAPEKHSFGDRELHLLEEIADNVRFALERFELEESRRSTSLALKESEERFRLAMRHSPMGMAIVGTDGRFLEVNPALCRIVDYSRAELQQKTFQSITHPEDLAVDEEFVRRALEGKISSYRMDKRYLLRGGGSVWVQLDAVLVRRDDGAALYFLAMVEDITQRREDERRIRELNATLEQRVAERTRELEIANRELEAFSSSVSHDLRSPLRLIEGFSQLLARNHVRADDVEGQKDLARIQKAAQRMAELIDSLLRLARLTRASIVRERVDLSAIARETLEALRSEQPEREVGVTIEPDLVVRGSATLLRAVVENLLGNAWKFTSKTGGATLAFGRESRGGEPMFFVRDNGAGFRMEHAGQLFRAFHRLHDEADFPGTGIGLATVQRIVQRHGGRIEVEGIEGRGATFWFTIPDREV